jgi:hypothetical protein
LDVHVPHEPIHSKKDFFLHLFTITVGLLIAVGIEGCVELHREHTLVKEARATLREEIDHNANAMKYAVTTIGRNRQVIQSDMDALTKIQEHPADKSLQHVALNAAFNIQSLNSAAWKTAQSTGALSYMPYAESQRYSDVYESQQMFLTQQDKILDDEAHFLGVMVKLNFGHGTITADQASTTLEPLGVWQAHLSYLDLTAKVCLAEEKAFLEGKDAPKSMNEDMSGGK